MNEWFKLRLNRSQEDIRRMAECNACRVSTSDIEV